MNLLKKENFITEIQCKTDISFHLILVGKGGQAVIFGYQANPVTQDKSNLVIVP